MSVRTSRRNFPNRVKARREKALENLRKVLAIYENQSGEFATRKVEYVKGQIGVLESRVKIV